MVHLQIILLHLYCLRLWLHGLLPAFNFDNYALDIKGSSKLTFVYARKLQ